MRRVSVAVVEGMFDIGLTGVLDTLSMANDLAPTLACPVPFAVELVGVRRRVRTQHGLGVPVQPVDSRRAPDIAMVPALGAKVPGALAQALGRNDVRETADWLAWAHGAGALVAAACTGTYVLAASGALDGARATTTWWLAADFRTRFPRVELDDTQMVVEDGRRVTAGAALAHIDLALWLVRQHSPELAALVSRYLVIDGRASQAAFSISDHLAHDDPVVRRFEHWCRSHLADFSMEAAARASGASERTLQRRVRRTLGRTPIGFVRDLRVERALHLLRTTDDAVDAIAEAVGYRDGVTLRALLREKTGATVGSLRRAP